MRYTNKKKDDWIDKREASERREAFGMSKKKYTIRKATETEDALYESGKEIGRKQALEEVLDFMNHQIGYNDSNYAYLKMWLEAKLKAVEKCQ